VGGQNHENFHFGSPEVDVETAHDTRFPRIVDRLTHIATHRLGARRESNNAAKGARSDALLTSTPMKMN
jgi:hypothetical protein